MIRNKRSIQTVAGLLILFFHLWIPVGPFKEAQELVRRMAFVGVDMFFFLSAWSLASGKIEDVPAFLKNRFVHVYLKFALFACFTALYKHWTLTRLLCVLSGVELCMKGGGSFLWFLPAILLLYLLAPILKRALEKSRVCTTLLVLGGWALFGFLCREYTAMYIFFNRIPICLLGFLCGSNTWIVKKVQETKFCQSVGLVLFGVGLVCGVLCVQPVLLQKPFPDFFYIGMIPMCIGLCLLLSNVSQNRLSKRIGSSTLEMYGLQMVFGPVLANKVLRLCGSSLCTNGVVCLLVCGAAVALSMVFEACVVGSIMKRKDEVRV